MKTKHLIIYIIICLIIIAGLAVWNTKGFREELQYSNRAQIGLSNYTGIEISDIEEIASEIFGNEKYFIQRVENFGNSVAIVADSISEEQRNEFVTKFNEKYGTELKNEDVEIVSIPFTRISDAIKPFIAPGIATLVLITIYFMIRYKNLGVRKVLLTTVAAPVVAELLMFSIMSMTRIPFGRLPISIGITLYILVILVLTVSFENKRNEYLESLQNINKEAVSENK